jgi:3D (Asp-Asp-Asp) domain-containing protein
MTKKIIKIRQISALVLLAIFAQIVVDLPTANAAIFGWLDNGNVPSDNNSNLTPVIPFLTANFRLSVSGEKTKSNLILTQGNFLVAYNSPEPKISSDPQKTELKVRELVIPITAYSSTPDQTDDTPFITAWGTYVREGIVAANFLPFGTKIKIPELFGDKIFIVEDRMNSKYWHRIDVWFPEKQDAIEFGVKITKIQIIES